MNELTTLTSQNLMAELENTENVCRALIKSPHYSRIGTEGIYAMVNKAKSIGLNPFDALNGGMYYVQGKVELTSAMMNQLIRMGKHSITKDKRSDDKICILHGKRADNGDTWTESFSLEDAKLAGIYRNQWLKYPKDMLFARALSRLARQLFPDVIKGCYVQGEISDAVDTEKLQQAHAEVVFTPITDDQFVEINDMIGEDHEYRDRFMKFLKSSYPNIETLRDMPSEIFEKALSKAKRNFEEKQIKAIGE